MKILYAVLFIICYWWLSNFYLLESRSNTIADQRVKSALDIATHDASLQLDVLQLDQGKIKFVPANVQSAFLSSLEKNLYLDGSLNPLNPSKNILPSAPSVLYLSGVDSGSFPQVINTNISGVPLITINNPSVVAVLEYTLPYKTISGKRNVKIVSIHQYKGY